jgi:hypothetical protein
MFQIIGKMAEFDRALTCERVAVGVRNENHFWPARKGGI